MKSSCGILTSLLMMIMVNEPKKNDYKNLNMKSTTESEFLNKDIHNA